MTVHTFTSLPRRISAACPTFHGFTQTEAKWYCRASAQSLAISFCVASGLSRVWSIRRAISDSVSGMVIWSCGRKGEDADVFQVAITFGVVEAVTDDEIVGDLETDVISFHLLDAARRLIEERGDAQGFGFALLEDAQQVRQGDAGVENVFNHDYVEAFDAAIEIFQQADLAGTFFIFSVAGDGDEIYRSFQIDFADQVGEEDAGTFQDADQVDALAAEIARDLVGYFADAFLDGGAADQDFQFFLAGDYGHFLESSLKERLL